MWQREANYPHNISCSLGDFSTRQVNGLDEANVKCYIRPYSTNYEEMSELPQPPDVPTFRNRHEVEKELSDAGLYYGTVDISSQ